MTPRRYSLILVGALLGFLDCRPKELADEMTDMRLTADGGAATQVKKYTLIDDFDSVMVIDGAKFTSPGAWKTSTSCSYTYAKVSTSPQNSLLISATTEIPCTLEWEKQFDSLIAPDATLNFYYQNNLKGTSEAHISMLDGQGGVIGADTPLPVPGSPMNTWVHQKVPIATKSVRFRLTINFASNPGSLFYVDDFFTVNTVSN